MKTFVQPGDVVSVTAPAAVASGTGVLVGSLFGIAVHSASAGQPVEIATRGVFRHAKAPSQAWTTGARIYWDDTAKVMTTTAASNKLVGVATEPVAGGAGDTIGVVFLTAAFTL